MLKIKGEAVYFPIYRAPRALYTTLYLLVKLLPMITSKVTTYDSFKVVKSFFLDKFFMGSEVK